jgi:hypothetical protein
MAGWRRNVQAVPEELARFVPSEWPDAGCSHEALQQWWRAGIAWEKDHPDSLPFGEYGDFIDVLREAERIRRGMPSCPPGSCHGRSV